MVVDAVAPWAETVLFTVDDLAALPDDSWRYELVEGRLVRMPPIGFAHGRMTTRLAVVLDTFVTREGRGTVITGDPGVILSRPGEPETVLAPDVAFVSAATIAPEQGLQETGFLRVIPELVVEVTSPGQHRPELAAKAKRWLGAGVHLVWIVWPQERQVDVWEASEGNEPRTFMAGDELDGGKVLPGFTLPLERLWS